MNLIDFYKSAISVASMTANNDGYVNISVDQESTPFVIDGKQVVLPIREQLRNSDWSSRIVFHPLNEAVQHNESIVMQKFRKAVNINLNMVVNNLIMNLIILSRTTAEHSKLSPNQAAVLTLLKNADDKTLSNYKQISKNLSANVSNNKGIVYLYLKRAGMVATKNYARVCVVTFPLFEELMKKEKTVYGVQIRNIDREIYINILKHLFPQIEEAGAYDKGSNSDIAPFMDCLLRSVYKLVDCTNATAEEYKDYFENAKGLIYNVDWIADLDNMGQFLKEIRSIPMQAGNDGNYTPAPVSATPTLQTPNPVNQPQYTQNAVQMPAPPVEQKRLTANGGLDPSAVLGPPQQMYPQQMPMGQYPQQMGMYPQQMQYPQYPQQMPMGPTPASLRNNSYPQMMPNNGYTGYQQMPQQAPQVQGFVNNQNRNYSGF